jgi:small multidrug resistance family-3 protein
VYIFVALLWLWLVEDIQPTGWDMTGAFVALVGMGIIMFAPREA